MKTKMIIVILILVSSISFSQNSDTTMVSSELERIYLNLEYNTSSFDDMKKHWVITDPEMVKDFSNKFIANNYVRINGENADRGFIEKFNNQISSGNVALDLRKRFFDNEIEYFAFIQNSNDSLTNGQPLFDPVLDGFYLQSIIGKEQYKELQSKIYFYTDVSSKKFSTKYGYNFDIYLNALSSHIMFWSTTSKNQNKYLLSLFGDWGNDNIHFIGWSLQQYIIGVQLTYYSKLQPDPRNYSYSVKFGTGLQSKVPYTTTVPDTPLLVSGQNFYGKLSASIFSKNLFLDLEGYMTLSDYVLSDYDFTDSTEFNSIRNFFSVELRAIKMYNFGDFGELEASVGIATHDFNEYIYNPIIDLIPYKKFLDRFNHFINGSIGVSKIGGLIQHKIDVCVGYNPEGYGYYGVGVNVMLSDTFGFDIRMRNAFGLDKVQYPWRMDSYLVFSPVFRINY